MLNPRRIGWGTTVLALLAIGVITLVPQPSPRWEGPAVPWWCVTCGAGGMVDAVLNVLLFVPLGAGLRWLGVPTWRAVLVAGATSLGIEVLQVFWVAGRDANIRDLFTNSTGAAIGVGLAAGWRQPLFPSVGLARLLVASVAVLWIATRIATTVLLRTSLPDGDWHGQIAPQNVYPADFRGEVIAASIGSHHFRSERLRDERVFRDALASQAKVRVLAVPAAPTAGLASIAGILDGRRREITLVGQDGDDARFRLRLRADEMGLRSPSVRVSDALRAGDTLELVGERTDGGLSLTVREGSDSRRSMVRFDAGLLWALFLPGDIPADERWPWFTAIWTAGWALLIGFWWGRGALERTWSLSMLLVAGLLLPSSIGGVGPAAPEVFATVLTGLAAARLPRLNFLLPT